MIFFSSVAGGKKMELCPPSREGIKPPQLSPYQKDLTVKSAVVVDNVKRINVL